MKVVASNGHQYLTEGDESYCVHGVEVGDEACKDCEDDMAAYDIEEAEE